MPDTPEPNTPGFLQFIAGVMLHGKKENIEDLPFGDTLKSDAELNSDFFTQSVNFLRRVFPNQKIQELATLQWDMVGNRMTPMAIGPVPTLSFTSFGNSDRQGFNPVVLLPQQWHKMCDENPIYQLGAVVFVGSQIRDYYNGRIFEGSGNRPTPVMQRAWAYETEYLNTMQRLAGDRFQLNEYQQEVAKKFPNGLADLPPGIQYQSKPWVKGEVSGAWKSPHDSSLN